MFLEAYRAATGEALPAMEGSETPDFVGKDDEGRVVGIEVTRFRFEQGERFWRRISAPGPGDVDAWLWLIDLMQKKIETLTGGRWSECARKILVIMMVDVSISDITRRGARTDQPDVGGFDEIWLADRTQVDAFGAVDLFAILHPTLEGHFATANQGQKPYG